MRSVSCLVVMTMWCVQGAVRLTSSMPARAKSGPSFELLKTRVHQRMQNKMKLGELGELGVSKEEVTFLPSLLPAVAGEQISFGLLDGEAVTGEIGAVTGAPDRFVWSGTVAGGTFYLSYAAGAIVANVYLPSRGVQYEYRPLDRSAGCYSLRAVPLSVYDEGAEEIRAHMGRAGPRGADWALETPHPAALNSMSVHDEGETEEAEEAEEQAHRSVGQMGGLRGGTHTHTHTHTHTRATHLSTELDHPKKVLVVPLSLLAPAARAAGTAGKYSVLYVL